MFYDTGVNDFSWSRLGRSISSRKEHPSTNLTKLATYGLVLDNAYTLPICSPSRAAVLTGVYPFKMGLQRGFSQQVPEGIPTTIKLLPEYLKTMGYNTHMFGKWHLGFCNTKYTPKERGFDSFDGRYVALEKKEKLDILKHDILNKTSHIKKEIKKKLIKRIKQIRKKSKNQKKLSLKIYNNWQKRKFENHKEVMKQLKQAKRKNHRLYSRRQERVRRSVDGFVKRPQDMESDTYQKRVAQILRSYAGKDTPFFIFLSFFTKSYRY